MLKHSIKVGFSFGITSGIITTLGLMVGLSSSTHSKLVVIGGILTIAVADAFSDALGIHISEESENKHTTREIWESTVSTFLFKFIFALTFIVPVLLFQLSLAVIVSLVWGFSLLGLLSYNMAKEQNEKPWNVVLEHWLVALMVVVLTNYIGSFIATKFN
ncbi:MAG: VIT1/CCC1 transporter family protein [Candidatus Margulisbacteria bacterium]|nr:VIT1/CCC1 transporter family protein [Candidatus Margulisiibacteriota bacterium]